MSESNKNNESSKMPGIYSKDWRCHLDEGHFCEKINSLKKRRRAYGGKITWKQ